MDDIRQYIPLWNYTLVLPYCMVAVCWLVYEYLRMVFGQIKPLCLFILILLIISCFREQRLLLLDQIGMELLFLRRLLPLGQRELL